MLQSLNHLCSPSLDSFWCVYVFLGLRSPELDAVLWEGGNSRFFSFSHQCQEQYKNGSAQLSPNPLSTILSIYPSQIKSSFRMSLYLGVKSSDFAPEQLWASSGPGPSFSQPWLRAEHVFNAVIFTLHTLRADPKPFETSGKLSLGFNGTLIRPLISYTSIIAQQESEGRTLYIPGTFFHSYCWKMEWQTSLRYSKKVEFFSPFRVSQKSTAPFVFPLFVPSPNKHINYLLFQPFNFQLQQPYWKELLTRKRTWIQTSAKSSLIYKIMRAILVLLSHFEK